MKQALQLRLAAKIHEYAASISKPRDAMASGNTVTQQLTDEFAAADAALPKAKGVADRFR